MPAIHMWAADAQRLPVRVRRGRDAGPFVHDTERPQLRSRDSPSARLRCARFSLGCSRYHMFAPGPWVVSVKLCK